MAQWLGQFTGHTHATKVKDAEDSLRLAFVAFRAAGTEEARREKSKAVHRLADRLMRARLKWVQARIAAANDIPSGTALERRTKEIESLERARVGLRNGGLSAILREFGGTDSSIG